MIKIGTLHIYDWNNSYDSNNCPYAIRSSFNIKYERHNSRYYSGTISIYKNKDGSYYVNSWGELSKVLVKITHKYDIGPFNSLKEAQNYIDNILNKILKLKAFI
jgi:hypothetical protein